MGPKQALVGVAFIVLCGGIWAQGAPMVLKTSFGADWVPYYAQDNGTWTGLDVELVTAIFSRAHLTWAADSAPSARGLAGIKSGAIDFLVAATKTADRAAFAWFSEPYRMEIDSLLGVTGAPARYPMAALSDMALYPDLRLAAERGGYFGPGFQRVLKDPALASQVDLNSSADSRLSMLLAGRVQFIVDDRFALVSLASNRRVLAKVEFHPLVLDEAPQTLMFSKASVDPVVVTSVNRAIDALKTDGTLQSIIDKYLH